MSTPVLAPMPMPVPVPATEFDSAVIALINALPGFEDEIDTIVATYKALKPRLIKADAYYVEEKMDSDVVEGFRTALNELKALKEVKALAEKSEAVVKKFKYDMEILQLFTEEAEGGVKAEEAEAEVKTEVKVEAKETDEAGAKDTNEAKAEASVSEVSKVPKSLEAPKASAPAPAPEAYVTEVSEVPESPGASEAPEAPEALEENRPCLTRLTRVLNPEIKSAAKGLKNLLLSKGDIVDGFLTAYKTFRVKMNKIDPVFYKGNKDELIKDLLREAFNKINAATGKADLNKTRREAVKALKAEMNLMSKLLKERKAVMKQSKMMTAPVSDAPVSDASGPESGIDAIAVPETVEDLTVSSTPASFIPTPLVEVEAQLLKPEASRVEAFRRAPLSPEPLALEPLSPLAPKSHIIEEGVISEAKEELRVFGLPLKRNEGSFILDSRIFDRDVRDSIKKV